MLASRLKTVKLDSGEDCVFIFSLALRQANSKSSCNFNLSYLVAHKPCWSVPHARQYPLPTRPLSCRPNKMLLQSDLLATTKHVF